MATVYGGDVNRRLAHQIAIDGQMWRPEKLTGKASLPKAGTIEKPEPELKVPEVIFAAETAADPEQAPALEPQRQSRIAQGIRALMTIIRNRGRAE